MKRITILIVTVLVALVSFLSTSNAGGWATVVLDEPISEVVIGEETTIAFQVLAHARPEAAVPGMHTTFLFLHEDTGLFVAVEGEVTADPTVYRITFTLDHAGEWDARAMIHNYVDTPLLTRFPAMTAVAATATTDA